MTLDNDLARWISAESVQIRRRIRILMLLDAADYAVVSPIAIPRFHALAFLADVLSPIYRFVPLSGRILKRRARPYFPDLQWEVNRLIGLSLVVPHERSPVTAKTEPYANAALSLERQRSARLLELAYSESEFRAHRSFFRELSGALSNLEDEDLDAATQSDVTWGAGSEGSVIDYAEWRPNNYSVMSTDRIEQFAARALGDRGAQLSPGAKVNLYVQYLKRAANA